MAGIQDIDIKLDNEWQLTAAANGDSLLTSGIESIIQDIKTEALTHEGDVFYDEEYGWSLLDFVQAQDDDLTRIEIKQRVQTKLSRRSEIDIETIDVKVDFNNDKLPIEVSFSFIFGPEKYVIKLELDRVKVEVVAVR